jgi:hypothetical protein
MGSRSDLRIDTVPEQTKYTESGEPVTASVTVSNTGSVEDAAALRTEVQIGGVILQAAGEGDG